MFGAKLRQGSATLVCQTLYRLLELIRSVVLNEIRCIHNVIDDVMLILSEIWNHKKKL